MNTTQRFETLSACVSTPGPPTHTPPFECLRTEHLQVCVFVSLCDGDTKNIYTTDTISSFIMSTQKLNEHSATLGVCTCTHTQPWATMRLIIALHLLHRQSLVNTLMLVKVVEVVPVLKTGRRMSLCPWPFWDIYHYRTRGSPDKSSQDFTAHRLLLTSPLW